MNTASATFNHVVVATGAWDLDITGTMDVNGDFTWSSGTTSADINGGIVAVAGNVTINGGTGGTGTIKFDGSNDQIWDQSNASGYSPTIEIDKSGCMGPAIFGR